MRLALLSAVLLAIATVAAPAAAAAPDSGIGDGAYTSPTYGYTLKWDPEIWEVDPDYEELVDFSDDVYKQVDSFALISEFGTLYVDGKVAYDGDPAACLDGEADHLVTGEGIEEVVPAEDEEGNPIAGETDVGASYGAWNVVYVDPEDEDAEEIELLDYFECYELIEGEAVLLITYITSESEKFEEYRERVADITDTIQLAGVASSGRRMKGNDGDSA